MKRISKEMKHCTQNNINFEQLKATINMEKGDEMEKPIKTECENIFQKKHFINLNKLSKLIQKTGITNYMGN